MRDITALKTVAEQFKHRGAQFWRDYDRDAAERQRLQDMCEDSGLVFCLPSLNPYSGE